MNYKAPVKDILFIRNNVFSFSEHYKSLGFNELTEETCEAILSEAAKFAENEIAPLNQSGDEEGCRISETGVTTPSGFKEAYRKYVEGGWPGLSSPEEDGGQGLPDSLALMVTEILGQANQSWSMYTGLSAGARSTISAHGDEKQKEIYLGNLVNGNWTGTMCLTEPQCGSDLSFLKTKAKPVGNDEYEISGTKIFISSGDHDLAENIVHIVLARLPDAPQGTRGISLFIVPKFIPEADGSLGKRNNVSCGALESKMGIHGNATCVMNFDNATGYMIGEPNKGLNCMFTFMNAARVGTAIQGITHAELALQGAWRYACERQAGRSLNGPQYPKQSADPLIVHPDVRRMLYTIRAFSEGNRAFATYLQKHIDINKYAHDENERSESEKILSFLTPIAKGFMTEAGQESASIGIQVFGGHGYIREWGMEQNLRDARISTLYEGTTGIQALDLLGRKIIGSKGDAFIHFIKHVHEEVSSIENQELKIALQEKVKEWEILTSDIGNSLVNGLDEIGAAANDYLMYSGYVILALMWAKMSDCAERLESSPFSRMKRTTAAFYFERILPRTDLHASLIRAGCKVLMQDKDIDLVDLAN